jgi:hypothetical protein
VSDRPYLSLKGRLLEFSQGEPRVQSRYEFEFSSPWTCRDLMRYCPVRLEVEEILVTPLPPVRIRISMMGGYLIWTASIQSSLWWSRLDGVVGCQVSRAWFQNWNDVLRRKLVSVSQVRSLFTNSQGSALSQTRLATPAFPI